MSLVVTLATLAEGAAPDARGNVTLVAVNPQAMAADQLPAQFAPVFYTAIEDDRESDQPRSIVPGRAISLKLQVTAPDGDVAFFFQSQQEVLPPNSPALPLRLQVMVPVPFTAAKSGYYVISAHIAIQLPDGGQDEVTATQRILITDMASLKSGTA